MRTCFRLDFPDFSRLASFSCPDPVPDPRFELPEVVPGCFQRVVQVFKVVRSRILSYYNNIGVAQIPDFLYFGSILMVLRGPQIDGLRLQIPGFRGFQRCSRGVQRSILVFKVVRKVHNESNWSVLMLFSDFRALLISFGGKSPSGSVDQNHSIGAISLKRGYRAHKGTQGVQQGITGEHRGITGEQAPGTLRGSGTGAGRVPVS